MKYFLELESQNLDLTKRCSAYKRLMKLNKHVETLFKKKSMEISLINN